LSFFYQEKEMRISKSLAGLLVGAAVGFLAPAARAEFSMQIVDNKTGEGFKIQENAAHTGFLMNPLNGLPASDVTWSATSGAINATATIDGYTFKVTGLSNQDTTPAPAMGQVSLSGSVTTNPGAAATSFSLYSGDSPFRFPASGSPLLVGTQVFTQSWNNGDVIKGQSQYVAYGDGPPQHYLTGATNVLGGSNQSSLSNQVMVPTSATPFALTVGSHGPQYALSNLVTLGMTGHVGTSNFWTQSAVAMPEPTGIIIGLLGVPCAAGLVLLSRRAAKVSAVA
jgi:hypothetical protein